MGYGAECTLAGHFSGLWDDLVHVTVRNTLHGDVGVWAPALLLGAVWVCSATLQLVGVCAAPRAIPGRDAGAGGRPWPQSGHAGAGHWRKRRAFNGLQSLLWILWCFIFINIFFNFKYINQCFAKWYTTILIHPTLNLFTVNVFIISVLNTHVRLL